MRKTPIGVFASIYIPFFIIIAVLAAVSEFHQIPVSTLTQDIALTANVEPFTGVLSSLGILLWCASAVICLFTWLLLRKKQEQPLSRFLLFSGLFTSLLLFDDLFMFHDFFAEPYLGINEKIIYFIYISLAVSYVIVFWRIILETDYILVLSAFAFFAVSIGLDQSFFPSTWFFLYEDGAKFLGIVHWFAYFARTSSRALDNSYLSTEQIHGKIVDPMKKKVKKTGNSVPDKPRKKHRFFESRFVHAVIIIYIGFLVYSNTFEVPFQWDDLSYIQKNALVKDLRYFLEPSETKGFDKYSDHFKRRYITYLTFALNYKVHGLNVTGYHIVNLSIHLLNALLIYLLVMLFYKTPFLEHSSIKQYSHHIAFFSALLFISHPLQTEAVTYIYQRLASLVAFFYLLSLAAYMKFRLSDSKNKRYLYFVLCLLSAILAMKTKENAVTLPVVIALVEFSFFTGPSKKRALMLFPLLLTVLIIPITLLDFDKPFASMIDSATKGAPYLSQRSEFFFTQFRVIIKYIGLLFVPANQSLIHDFPLSSSLFEPQVMTSFLFLIGILSSAVYLFHRSKTSAPDFRLIAAGIFWFFITISIEAGPIRLSMIMHEYRTYLPSAILFTSFSTGFFLLLSKIKVQKKQTALLLSFIIIVLACSFLTYRRNSTWQTTIRLWEDNARKAPNSARVQFNLGNHYRSIDLLEKAVEHYESALKISPDYVDVYISLADIYNAKGLFDKAMEHLQHALRLNPDSAKAHYFLAHNYYNRGLDNKAIEQLLTATQLDPNLFEAHYQLASAYHFKGLYDDAIKHYKNALRLQPDNADVHYNLGITYETIGLADRAEEQFSTALRLNPTLRDKMKEKENSGNLK